MRKLGNSVKTFSLTLTLASKFPDDYYICGVEESWVRFQYVASGDVIWDSVSLISKEFMLIHPFLHQQFGMLMQHLHIGSVMS